MESKIEFVLKPVTGAASTGGGYRAILNTSKGDAMDFDDVITSAAWLGEIEKHENEDDDDDEEPPRSTHAGGCLTSVIMALGVTVAIGVLLFHI